MAWTIDYDKAVRKQVEKLDAANRNLMRSFLHDRLASHDDPRQLGAALQGSEFGRYWRYRVGDYRIISRTGG